MLSFVIRRLLQSVLVILIIAFISFIIFRYVGDPVSQMVGPNTPQVEIDRIRESLNLNKSVFAQFWSFIWNALHFNFGVSYQFRQPVSTLLLDRLPATLELSFVAALFALVLGVSLGAYTAIYHNSALTRLLQAVSLIGVSLPTFLIGIFLIYIFAVQLRWLPSNGRGDVVALGSWWTSGLLTASGLKALIMPAITLGLFQMTLIMRLVYAEMREVMRMDFIKFARARGLSQYNLYFKHALKNALLPVITITGLQLGSIIAFAIITESVFNWPGMGLFFIKAVEHVDIPIMSAYLMLVGSLFVAINLVVDLLYTFIDPRVKIVAQKS